MRVPSTIRRCAAGALLRYASLALAFLAAAVPSSAQGAPAPIPPSPQQAAVAERQAGFRPLAMPSESVPRAFAGTLYRASVMASGGVAPYQMMVSGKLPPGLSYQSGFTVLVISGVPSQAGAFDAEVTAIDANGATVTKPFHFDVLSPAVTPSPAVVSVPETFHITDTNNIFFPAVVNISEPFHITDGSITHPSIDVMTPELFHITDTTSVMLGLMVPDAETFHITDTIAVNLALGILPLAAPSGTYNAAYNQTFTAVGNTGPATLTPSGTLPVGLGFNCSGASCTLSGTPLQAGVFSFSLKAQDSANTTTVAYALTIAQASQTINLGTLPAPTFGDPPFTLNVTATSGLPVTITLLNGPVTGSGSGPYTITGAGQVNFTASQGGNGNYAAATTVNFSVNIAKASQTINLGTLPMPVYGGAPFSVNPTATSGLPVTVSYVSGPATGTGTGPFTATGAGPVYFTASQGGNTNYSAATSVNFSVTVAKQASITTVTALPTSVTPVQNVTLTATVAAASTGTPSGGSITFFDNNVQIGNPILIAAGQAQLTLPLLSGPHTISATYTGDANFLTSSGTAASIVTVAPLDFTLNPLSTLNLNVVPGQAASFSFNVAPLYVIYPGPVTFAVTGLPTGATSTVTPTAIAANGGPQTVTVTIQTPAALVRNATPRRVPNSAAPVALALLLPMLTWGAVRRRRWLSATLLLLVAVCAGSAVTGCSTGTGFFGQSSHTYAVAVTASSGTMQHTLNVNLQIQ